MSETPDLFEPAVPPVVRTVVYACGLIAGFLSILVTGIGAIYWPEHATAITATAGVVGSAFGFLAGALGVVYRPTQATTAGRHAGE